MTEVNYGFIVSMFTLAYAVGLLVAAGSLTRLLAHRLHGHHGRLELSAMGHALANKLLIWHCRFSLDWANPATSCRSQDRRRVVPAERAIPRHRIFNSAPTSALCWLRSLSPLSRCTLVGTRHSWSLPFQCHLDPLLVRKIP